MGVRRHEDLICWQLSMKLHERVVAIVAKDTVKHDWRFCEQLLDASSSAAPNIAEGFARYSKADFSRFLRIALGSLAETKTHLQQGRQRGYLSIEDYEEALSLARRAAAATSGLRASIPGPPTPLREPSRVAGNHREDDQKPDR
jgi:four helix bundle protein